MDLTKKNSSAFSDLCKVIFFFFFFWQSWCHSSKLNPHSPTLATMTWSWPPLTTMFLVCSWLHISSVTLLKQRPKSLFSLLGGNHKNSEQIKYIFFCVFPKTWQNDLGQSFNGVTTYQHTSTQDGFLGTSCSSCSAFPAWTRSTTAGRGYYCIVHKSLVAYSCQLDFL